MAVHLQFMASTMNVPVWEQYTGEDIAKYQHDQHVHGAVLVKVLKTCCNTSRLESCGQAHTPDGNELHGYFQCGPGRMAWLLAVSTRGCTGLVYIYVI